MKVTQCTKADFDQIIAENEDFWGHNRVKNLHNPVYLYEFGNTECVIREGEKVIGYLFGLFHRQNLLPTLSLSV